VRRPATGSLPASLAGTAARVHARTAEHEVPPDTA
jgi:hypothetical protein